MRTGVSGEIAAYHAMHKATAGRVVNQAGFQVFCAHGLLPPTNRVTRSFSEAIRDERANRVLDLGCGTGILALVASRYARSIVGIDNDMRAVECARLNAALNNVNSIEFRQGNGFEPVEKCQFDLIVSNPPFYPAVNGEISPSSMCLRGDEQQDLLFLLIKGISQHLTPAGKCLFVTSSLSDNQLVRKILIENDLRFNTRLLSKGRNQVILLWDSRIK